MEYRAIQQTAAYLDEWDATDPKHRSALKDSPMIRLVRDLQSARNDRIRQDGIRRKLGGPRG